MKTPIFDRPLFVSLLIVAQALCAAFFLFDVVADGFEMGLAGFFTSHFGIEFIAVVALIAGILFEIRVLSGMLQRTAHLERQVSQASKALHEVIEAHLDRWGLTPSERDVAHFTIKGLSIADIARLRGSAEGTIKSNLNAIYRKAGASNRGELLALLLDDLMDYRSDPDPTVGLSAQTSPR